MRSTDRAAALGIAVVVSLGMLATGCTSASQPTTTTDPVPTTHTSVPPSTAAEQVKTIDGVALSDEELLTEEDLPADLDWQVFDETSDPDNTINHGVLAIRCADSQSEESGGKVWRLDPSPRSYDPDKPWFRLDDALFKAMYSGATYSDAGEAVFGQALYSGEHAAVTESFNMMKAVTLDCLDSEDIGAGHGGEVERLAMPPVGDDSITMKLTFPLRPSQTPYDILRLAIVRDGTRLLIVEEHELVASTDDPPRVTDAEFIAVVQTAADRLET